MIFVTYAGAGGGKTTNMIKRVKERLDKVRPNRFVAIITYTNEAAYDIRVKMGREMIIPSNFFIGTIHAFLIRFVIRPYIKNGAMYSFISGINDKDEVIADYKKWAEGKFPNDLIKQKAVTNAYWFKIRSRIYSSLEKSEFMTYDQIISISKKLISKANIRNALSTKLQYVFVDEYQDSNIWQHEIFMEIHKDGKNELHVIGDPNQSIYGFTYGTSENNIQRPKDYDDFPIIKIKKECHNFIELDINFRSSQEIVDLANKYNRVFQQKSDMGSVNPVIVITESETDKIINVFNQKRIELGLHGKIFYLAKENATLKSFDEKIIDKVKNHKDIKSIEECIVQCAGMNILNFCEINQINRLQFRALAVMCEENEIIDIDLIRNKFLKKFKVNMKSLATDKFKQPKPKSLSVNQEVRALTIHKCKGLEAESVVVIFESNNHLSKAIKKKAIMASPTDDDLRLIYVAFTRAKKLLAIACKEKISDENIKSLIQHGVEIAGA
ncbi:UvrD-helicase domain-containing protein [Yersinia rohdei]|uniref:UvrD-helicase domain-containing protein n=1 Tax=Yersinia rohdei TaxID=29485 RepID=UPI00119DCC3B|nr:UvrD-helicase domain-containing protein [Yersinia rohdei]